MTMGNLCLFVAAFAVAMTTSLVRANECICTIRTDSYERNIANCSTKDLTEIPQCVTNRTLQLKVLYVFLKPLRFFAQML